MEQKKKKWLWKQFAIIQLIIAVAVTAIVLIMNSETVRKENEALDLRREKYELELQSDSLQLELDKLHTLSWENVVYWIDTLGIDHPEIVMQQVALETGMLSSTICSENNNLFGMKEPRVRETTALGTKRGHAYYENYVDSIKDYKLWQDNMYNGGDYYAFLNRVGYAEARHYIAALKTI